MNLDQLKNRDYYIVLDKSGSMIATDTPSGQSRWKYAEESLTAIAQRLAEYDPDGITVVPFSGSFKAHENVTPNIVGQIFKEHEPMGATVLAAPLKWCFDNYLSNKTAGKAKANGAIVVVLTDGEPQDQNQVAKEIVSFTKKLDNGDGEFGISMLQVGKDVAAKQFLQRLDDDLQKEGAKFDIVDTKTMDELETIGLTEAVLASLTD